MIRVEHNPAFVTDVRGFEDLERSRVIEHMRSIERAPFAMPPNRHFLPFPWRPGTIQADFDDVSIRYFVTRDDETGESALVFVRVYRRVLVVGGFDVM